MENPSWNSLVTQRVPFLASILSCSHALGSLALLLQLARSNSSNFQLLLLFPIMSSSSATSISQADIIQSSKPVQALLNNPLHVPQPGLAALVDWIVKVGFALVGMVTNLAKQLADQADKAYKTACQASAQFSTSVPAATTSTATSQRGTATSSKRCNQCHTRGHTVNDCKTTQPSAMHKQVARNNRIAKEARHAPAQPPPSVPPPPPWLPSHYPPP